MPETPYERFVERCWYLTDRLLSHAAVAAIWQALGHRPSEEFWTRFHRAWKALGDIKTGVAEYEARNEPLPAEWMDERARCLGRHAAEVTAQFGREMSQFARSVVDDSRPDRFGSVADAVDRMDYIR